MVNWFIFKFIERPTKNEVLLILLVLLSPLKLLADPIPGDIFREYRFADGRGIHLCPQGVKYDSISFSINVDDLKSAVKAELTGMFHTGHIGTSERKIRINGGKIIDVPEAEISSGKNECYFTYIFGRPAVEFPLSDLKEGENILTLFVGPQICHGFNWPCCGFHSMILRVYYDSNKPHPTGEIEYPKSGHIITNDELMIKTKARSGKAAISSVDIVGQYFDYPFEGSGKYFDWHYLINEFGQWFSFINRNNKSPYHETWNLEWLPDQEEPIKLMAKITDSDGISYMTPAIENITLKRDNYSVKMYKTTDIPENFKVRVNETKKSHFEPITDVSRIKEVQLVSIIPVGHLEQKYFSVCGINEIVLKRYDDLPDFKSDFFYDSYLQVDTKILKAGVNEFFIYSNTEGHMTEVCWPGPALLVRYENEQEKK